MIFVFFVCLGSEEESEEIRSNQTGWLFVAGLSLQLISGKPPLSASVRLVLAVWDLNSLSLIYV